MTRKETGPWVPIIASSTLSVFFLCGAVQAGQIDFGTYIRMSVGMSEAEVLMRAGEPDREIYFDLEFPHASKQMLYLPDPGEPDPRLTILSVEFGRVVAIERSPVFSRPRRNVGGQIDTAAFNRFHLGMSEGEVYVIAGFPDREVYLGETRQLSYIPRPEEPDPHLTIITTHRGRVVGLERKKIFFPFPP